MGELEQKQSFLEMVEKPNVVGLVKNALYYGFYDEYKPAAHNSKKPIDPAEFEKLCGIIYRKWYNAVKTIDENKLKEERPDLYSALIKLKNDPRFSVDEVAKRGFYNFFEEEYQNEFPKAGFRAAHPQEGNMMPFKSGGFQDDFFHVKSNFLTGVRFPIPIECRLYLNLKIENVNKVALEFMKRCDAEGLPFYYKIANNDERNDPFLVYSNYANAPKYLKVLEGLKKDNPSLFEGCENISPSLGKINGWIGFGEEPVIMKSENSKYSYNSVRSEAILEMLREERKEFSKYFLIQENNNKLNNWFYRNYTFDDILKKLIKENVLKKQLSGYKEGNFNDISSSELEYIKDNILGCKPLQNNIGVQDKNGKYYYVDLGKYDLSGALFSIYNIKGENQLEKYAKLNELIFIGDDFKKKGFDKKLSSFVEDRIIEKIKYEIRVAEYCKERGIRPDLVSNLENLCLLDQNLKNDSTRLMHINTINVARICHEMSKGERFSVDLIYPANISNHTKFVRFSNNDIKKTLMSLMNIEVNFNEKNLESKLNKYDVDFNNFCLNFSSAQKLKLAIKK